MSVGWSSLTFEPTDDAIEQLAEAWAWRLRVPFRPVLFSTLGDMFFARDDGAVWWLNTGTAELTRVADSIEHFHERLATDVADEWFLPALIEKLQLAGKMREAGECYTYVTLPIFAEGKYEVDNLNPVSAAEHFELTGHIHRQIAELPDGAKVRTTH
jgi:hypothetical protein